MNISSHAQTRSRQRGISNDHLKLLIAFGQSERRPGNVTAIYLDEKGTRNLERILRAGIQLIDKLKGHELIQADDGTVVTCYHQTKKKRLRRR